MVESVHVSGLLTRCMTAGPDGVRDPIPNSPAALGGRDSYRVLWIVGSTDRHLVALFHPGINARSGGFGERLIALTCVVRDPMPVRAIPLFSRGRSRVVVRVPATRR